MTGCETDLLLRSAIRFEAAVRFHVQVMLGLDSESDPLPDPASAGERAGWDFEKNLDDLELGLDERSLDPNYSRFPGGPGNRHASFQQISVIINLMRKVNLERFWPNFAESALSRENKWLWQLSLKIFLKLVEYGEYPGIVLDTDNQEFINKCFMTHIQTLKKRFDGFILSAHTLYVA